MCKKHNGTHTWDQCFDNPKGSNYMNKNGVGGRGSEGQDVGCSERGGYGGRGGGQGGYQGQGSSYHNNNSYQNYNSNTNYPQQNTNYHRQNNGPPPIGNFDQAKQSVNHYLPQQERPVSTLNSMRPVRLQFFIIWVNFTQDLFLFGFSFWSRIDWEKMLVIMLIKKIYFIA